MLCQASSNAPITVSQYLYVFDDMSRGLKPVGFVAFDRNVYPQPYYSIQSHLWQQTTRLQYHYRDVLKIALWSLGHISNHSTVNFTPISKSIEIPLVGREPVQERSHSIDMVCMEYSWFNNRRVTTQWGLVTHIYAVEHLVLCSRHSFGAMLLPAILNWILRNKCQVDLKQISIVFFLENVF